MSARRRIALVSCSKTKVRQAALARDLYSSPLFRNSRAYAERHCDAWFILSAKLGLVAPWSWVEPYDLDLSQLSDEARQRWARLVHEQLDLAGVLRPGTEFIWLAGRSYQADLSRLLAAFPQSNPLQGLDLEARIRWLDQQLARTAPVIGSTRPSAPAEAGDTVRILYDLVEQHSRRHGGLIRISDLTLGTRIPRQGVYFVFEDGELRADGAPRIVRVGTHGIREGSRATLISRLLQHRGNLRPPGGNHRGSVFRLHVGAALIRSGQSPIPAPEWGRGSSATLAVKEAERPLEALVTEVLGRMRVGCVEVSDDPGPRSLRAYLERNAIALLTSASVRAQEPASAAWLGRHAPSPSIQKVGLWNVSHAGATVDPTFPRYLDDLLRNQ